MFNTNSVYLCGFLNKFPLRLFPFITSVFDLFIILILFTHVFIFEIYTLKKTKIKHMHVHTHTHTHAHTRMGVRQRYFMKG